MQSDPHSNVPTSNIKSSQKRLFLNSNTNKTLKDQYEFLKTDTLYNSGLMQSRYFNITLIGLSDELTMDIVNLYFNNKL